MIDPPPRLRPPSQSECIIWHAYRNWCIDKRRPDPGDCPSAWPTEPQASAQILQMLASIVVDGELDKDEAARRLLRDWLKLAS